MLNQTTIKLSLFKKLNLSLVLLMSIVFLGACAPSQTIENNVIPTLFSVKRPSNTGQTLLLQGRYFGDGQNFQATDSYVILGADINGKGGVEVIPTAWSTTKLNVTIPENAGAGFVFVVVDGTKSNGLPANIQ